MQWWISSFILILWGDVILLVIAFIRLNCVADCKKSVINIAENDDFLSWDEYTFYLNYVDEIPSKLETKLAPKSGLIIVNSKKTAL